MSTTKLEIEARAARIVDELHPFQREFNDTLQDHSIRVMCVEAPVGAGKSHIVRGVLEQRNDAMVVLTYPTKILMQTQLSALREELARDGKDLCVWPDPDDEFRPNAVNVVNYSTDAVMQQLRKHGDAVLKETRGELLNRLFNEQKWRGQERAVVTSPDVLHLVSRHRYKEAERLMQWLRNGLFVFDEFHLYHNLENFVPLLDRILNTWNGRIVLLSATPIEREELRDLLAQYPTRRIQFAPQSIGAPASPPVRVFNYPLTVEIESFKTTDLAKWIPRLQRFLPTLRRPIAIILDSVHRVQWLRRDLERMVRERGWNLVEWSGLTKDRVPLPLPDDTVVLGTAAIEVGIDMKFRSLIFEAAYWPSAIQRLGRVGRHCEGTAVIFSRRVFDPFLRERKEWDRTDFEQQVLCQALLKPAEGMIGGEMFRGDSYNFALFDTETRRPKYYDESIFAMYDIEYPIQEWRDLDSNEKREELRDLGLTGHYVDEVLLRDKVFPFWGVVSGRLRPDYVQVYATERRDELEIRADQSYFFAKGVPVTFEVEE